MTAAPISLEFYAAQDTERSAMLGHAIVGHVPQKGSIVMLRESGPYARYRVVEVEYWFDLERETATSVRIAVVVLARLRDT